MPFELSPAKTLVLRCCANPDLNRADQFAVLSHDEECDLIRLALQTRTAALLHRASQGLKSQLTDDLSQIAKQYSLHNLRAGRVLAEVLNLLAPEGLSPIALKGVPLAFEGYPDPSLRPLRDLDLLFEPDEAVRAQNLLLGLPQFDFAPKAGRYGLGHSHQLPELVHLPSGIIIELHHRLNARDWPRELRALKAIFDEATEVELLGTKARVPSMISNCLHLLEHATLHHALANGPLILSDLHYLMKGGQNSMAELANQVANVGLQRPLALISKVAFELEAEWPAETLFAAQMIEAKFVDAAMTAMLLDEEQVAQHDQRMRAGNTEPGLIYGLKRVLDPDPNELGKYSGKSADSIARWLGYPLWLIKKGKRYLRGLHSKSLNAQFEARDALIKWMVP